eukprot:SAG31_NODE_41058_length_278_cov_0.564246_1_plen_42_part_01
MPRILVFRLNLQRWLQLYVGKSLAITKTKFGQKSCRLMRGRR